MFRRQIITQINIEASPEEIWQHLTDFASYPQWNPFIAAIEGDLRVGSRLTVTLNQQNGKKF